MTPTGVCKGVGGVGPAATADVDFSTARLFVSAAEAEAALDGVKHTAAAPVVGAEVATVRAGSAGALVAGALTGATADGPAADAGDAAVTGEPMAVVVLVLVVAAAAATAVVAAGAVDTGKELRLSGAATAELAAATAANVPGDELDGRRDGERWGRLRSNTRGPEGETCDA